MRTIKVKRDDLNFYKTIVIALGSIIIVSWFIYALFSEHYIGYQYFNNMKYLFRESVRPDFVIYFVVIPLMTTFWNIIFQPWYPVKYLVKSYPIIYMMSPFFLDNFYFLLNHVPGRTRIEIQFIFISSPTVTQYQFLTIFYFLIGFLVMIKAERIWQVVLAIAFAIAEYSSLIISTLIEPQVMEEAIFIASAIPIYGVFIGNQLRLWFISFQTNSDAYLWSYFLIVIIIIIIFGVARYRLGTEWWRKTPKQITTHRITKIIEIID